MPRPGHDDHDEEVDPEMTLAASAPDPRRIIDWAVAGRMLPGERESGDLHIVQVFPGGVLVAVIDGLGHGPEAATAARLAGETLQAHAQEPVSDLFRRCHDDIRSTRGVVMTIVSIDPRAATLTWLGVGNVEGYLVRAQTAAMRRREAAASIGGVIGLQLPRRLQPTSLAVEAGDTLVLATDGITSDFIEGIRPGPPQEIAEAILAGFAKATDDALVLVARYEAPPR
jgi:negative regulator of sigma-B (phosphoserine phosphatase)